MTQPPDTAAAEKLATDRVLNEDFDGHDDDESDKIAWAVISLREQLTAANERADRATAEAAVLLATIERIRQRYSLEDKYEENVTDICINKAPLAAAFLSEHRRLVEQQRTPRTREVCERCSSHLDKIAASSARGKWTMRCGEEDCPLKSIRAGAK